MPRPPSRKGKINCVHCGRLFHPYRQGDIRLCKGCIKAVRLHFWKSKTFFTPQCQDVDSLSEKEIHVLMTCMRLSGGKTDELEEEWKKLEDSAKRHFSGWDLFNTYAREGKFFLKSNLKSIRTVTQNDLAKAVGWSRPTLDAIIAPMFEYGVLLRVSRTGIILNIPLVHERVIGRPLHEAEEFYASLKHLK